jgi:hypothetical protein
VHKLTPYDVGTIAAMGDSITAAFAACAHCIVEIVEECRGASWSIGGVDDFSSSVTLPNIIKQCVPSPLTYTPYFCIDFTWSAGTTPTSQASARAQTSQNCPVCAPSLASLFTPTDAA